MINPTAKEPKRHMGQTRNDSIHKHSSQPERIQISRRLRLLGIEIAERKLHSGYRCRRRNCNQRQLQFGWLYRATNAGLAGLASDGAVIASDFNAFRLDYGGAGPLIFDFDGIGGVNVTEFNFFPVAIWRYQLPTVSGKDLNAIVGR